MDYSFTSEKELFERVKPALHAKVQELKRLSYKDITELDIWKYLIEAKWIRSKNLTLSDIVSDILHLDNKIIYSYVKNKEV